MTRCSDLGLILAVVLLAEPASAEPLVSDAFGLYDPAATAPERRDWAGWTEGAFAGSIAPQGPDRLVIFAGPKSSVAGKDPSHVVAIVVDAFGNMVSDGTDALVSVEGELSRTETVGGIADLLLAPRTKAGDLFVGVTAADRQSPQAMISIVADIASIRTDVAGPQAEVLVDTAFDVRSAALSDQFGNPVPQGTGATVILRHADGSYSQGSGLVMQDRALLRFIARDIPGPAEAVMTLGAQRSDSVDLTIRPPTPVGLPALELASLPEIGALRITLGPFLTTDGYALADGAQVTITAFLSDGTRVTEGAWVQDGEISMMLPIRDPLAVNRLSVLSPLGPMDLTPDWQAARAALPAAREPGP